MLRDNIYNLSYQWKDIFQLYKKEPEKLLTIFFTFLNPGFQKNNFSLLL